MDSILQMTSCNNLHVLPKSVGFSANIASNFLNNVCFSPLKFDPRAKTPFLNSLPSLTTHPRPKKSTKTLIPYAICQNSSHFLSKTSTFSPKTHQNPKNRNLRGWFPLQTENQTDSQFQFLHRNRFIAHQDEFDMDDFEGFEGEEDMGGEMEDEEQEGDMEVEVESEYDMPEGSFSVKDSEIGGGGKSHWVEVEEVEYKIEEKKFHKIKLHACDFFVRKVEDEDDDVYDFQEIYVSAPDTDVYAIPKIFGTMPTTPLRCMRGEWKVLVTKLLPVNGVPRAPMAASQDQIAKIFLIKHFQNGRDREEDFVLDFEEIYVIDGSDRSIKKADVKVDVPGGPERDRNLETLIVRDNGTSFRIILDEKKSTPDEIIEEYQFQKSRAALDGFLRGYRDYEKSNWF